MTPTSLEILKALETTTINHFEIVFLIPAVLFVYAYVISKKNWPAVFGGLAFFFADVFNELADTIVLFASGYAPIWGTPKASSTGWLLLPGWCFEIACMFAIGAVPFILIDGVFQKKWSAQKQIGYDVASTQNYRMKKFAGLYLSQWVLAFAGSLLALVVEMLLNRAGLLTWEWAWWGKSGGLSLIPVFVLGYLWFYCFAFWVSNRETVKKQAIAVSVLAAIDLILFMFCLCRDWIITYNPPAV